MVIVPAAAAATIASLTRHCPKCKKKQMVPASKRKEKVKCKNCGAEIPAVKH